MSLRRISADLPVLLAETARLLEGRLTYEDALRGHFSKLLAFYGGDRSRIWSIDAIHEHFV